jgi:BolA protein
MGSLSGAWQLALGAAEGTSDMSAMQSRTARLEALLRQAFSPTLLRVEDDSARHADHTEAYPGGETHYNVLLVTAAFRGMNRLARSRAVHRAVAPEFAGGMHALSLTLRTPEEAAAGEH